MESERRVNMAYARWATKDEIIKQTTKITKTVPEKISLLDIIYVITYKISIVADKNIGDISLSSIKSYAVAVEDKVINKK